ncbi:MAG: DUF4350 domain-containing protein [Planctomycetota bacterium]
MTLPAIARRALLALSFAAVLHSCGEYEEREVEVGYRGEARRNPYLAAERFAERMGFAVESRMDLPVPGPEVGAVLAPSEWLALDNERTRGVREWVERGGQLVVTVFGMERPAYPAWYAKGADGASTGGHPLFDEFSVEVEGPDEEDSLASMHDDWDLGRELVGGRGIFEGLQVNFAASGTLDLDAARSWSDRVGPPGRARAASFEVGDGRITFLVDGSPFWNGALGADDDAEFLWRLLRDAPRPRVWFVHGRDESIVTLLVERAPQFTLAAVLLVVLWLWRLSARFGPPIQEPPPERHSYLEHVRATGRFLRRNAGNASLVEPWRRRALRVARSGGALVDRHHEHAVEALAARSGLSPERVDAVLFGPVPTDAGELVAAIRDLQRCQRAR